MTGTSTIKVDMERMQASPAASLIIRLMMACNDIAMANVCLSKFKEEAQPPIRRHVKLGAMMYFVRLQCGHMTEAMKLVEEIQDNKCLSDMVKRCSDYGKCAFDKLCACRRSSDFQKYVGRIRQNVAFHYDEKLVERALKDRAGRPEARLSSITRGSDIRLWRFNLADDIHDSIVCRQIWEIQREEDLRKRADECADYGSDICRSFLDFCGESIFCYVLEYCAE